MQKNRALSNMVEAPERQTGQRHGDRETERERERKQYHTEEARQRGVAIKPQTQEMVGQRALSKGGTGYDIDNLVGVGVIL